MTKKGGGGGGGGLLRWVPVQVNGCSSVQVEVVGMCFDGQTLLKGSRTETFYAVVRSA